MLKLKLQYFGHLRRGANSLEKALMLGKIECKKEKGPADDGWLDSITNSMHMNLSKLQERVRYREAWPAAVRGVTKNGYNSVTEEQLPLKEKGKYINL